MARVLRAIGVEKGKYVFSTEVCELAFERAIRKDNGSSEAELSRRDLTAALTSVSGHPAGACSRAVTEILRRKAAAGAIRMIRAGLWRVLVKLV